MLRLSFLACVVLVLASCASSGPSQGPDGSLRSRPITLAVPFESVQNPLMRPPALTVQARAVCGGNEEGCAGVYLDFRNPGGNDLYLNYTPVTAQVDGELYQWPEIVANEQRVSVAVGVFLRLSFDPVKFRQLAFAQEVTFNLGSTPFALDYQQRAPFRELLDRMQ